jgi:hypothetical protein
MGEGTATGDFAAEAAKFGATVFLKRSILSPNSGQRVERGYQGCPGYLVFSDRGALFACLSDQSR